MKKIGLRSALTKLGATDIELHWSGGPACREQSGFFVGHGEHFTEGQLYYVAFHKMSLADLPRIMHRTAKHRKDWTGGQNQWGLEGILERMGYIVS